MSAAWLPAAVEVGVFAAMGGLFALVVRSLKRGLDDVADMRSVARAHASQAREGAVVRVVGRVLDQDPMLVAPVSGRRCVAYDFELRYGNGELITAGSASVPFILDDEGARAVTSAACRVLALRRRLDERSRPEELPVAFAAWLEENHASDEWRLERALRWRESRVEPGDRVAVVGVARREIAQQGQGGYRDAPTLLMLDDADDAPLSIGDDPSLLEPLSAPRT
jgi:hypothetical protein